MWRILTRGWAIFIGLFLLTNQLGGLLRPGFDRSIWLVDLRSLPWLVRLAVFILSGSLLLAWGLSPHAGKPRRWATTLAAAALAAFAMADNVRFFILIAAHAIVPDVPIPLSLFITLAMAATAGTMFHVEHPGAAPSRQAWRTRLGVAAVALACPVLLALAQMLFFGCTDYRKPADAAVVFGARTYADGTPSQALADRVRTACELYRQGLVPTLIFSGGPGDGPTDEPTAMRNLALSLGVPDSAILLDSAGLNTADTARHTAAICRRLGVTRLLAVSHAYHLPRVQLALARAGLGVRTVPARQTQVLTQMPWLVAREVAAVWVYYLKA